MIYKLRIMRAAQNDMRKAYLYIAKDLQNPAAASRRIGLIDKAIQSLKEQPSRCPLVQDDYLASKGYRMMIVKNHLVFFIVRENIKTVSIMRVLYGRRDWQQLLKLPLS